MLDYVRAVLSNREGRENSASTKSLAPRGSTRQSLTRSAVEPLTPRSTVSGHSRSSTSLGGVSQQRQQLRNSNSERSLSNASARSSRRSTLGTPAVANLSSREARVPLGAFPPSPSARSRASRASGFGGDGASAGGGSGKPGTMEEPSTLVTGLDEEAELLLARRRVVELTRETDALQAELHRERRGHREHVALLTEELNAARKDLANQKNCSCAPGGGDTAGYVGQSSGSGASAAQKDTDTKANIEALQARIQQQEEWAREQRQKERKWLMQISSLERERGELRCERRTLQQRLDRMEQSEATGASPAKTPTKGHRHSLPCLGNNVIEDLQGSSENNGPMEANAESRSRTEELSTAASEVLEMPDNVLRERASSVLEVSRKSGNEKHDWKRRWLSQISALERENHEWRRERRVLERRLEQLIGSMQEAAVAAAAEDTSDAALDEIPAASPRETATEEDDFVVQDATLRDFEDEVHVKLEGLAHIMGQILGQYSQLEDGHGASPMDNAAAIGQLVNKIYGRDHSGEEGMGRRFSDP